MQPVNRVNDNLVQFIKLEHYRMHCVEQWADGPRKETALAAIHSALDRLEAALVGPCDRPACMVCAAKKNPAPVIMFPSRAKGAPAVLRPAA